MAQILVFRVAVFHQSDVVSIALISLMVYLLAATSVSLAALTQVLSSGHSMPIELMRVPASSQRCAQLPSAIDALSKFYRSVSWPIHVAIAETT